jgi:hypothetical protein
MRFRVHAEPVIGPRLARTRWRAPEMPMFSGPTEGHMAGVAFARCPSTPRRSKLDPFTNVLPRTTLDPPSPVTRVIRLALQVLLRSPTPGGASLPISLSLIGSRRLLNSRRQRLHLRIEIGFALEADPRQIRHGDVIVLDANAVGETAIGLEQIGIALIAAETETGRDVERHLMAPVGNAPARRPALGLEHAKRALIFAEPVRQRAIELQPVAIMAHPAIADEVARVWLTNEIFQDR